MEVRRDEDRIDVILGFRQSWERLRSELGIGIIATAIASVLALLVTNGIAAALKTDSIAIRVVPTLAIAGLILSLSVRVAVRHHWTKVTFRVTRERLTVFFKEPFRPPREIGWRRDAIFEVRSGASGALHVRLQREAPYKLLFGRSAQEINSAVEAINAAMDMLPPLALPADSSGVLMYEPPGRPYEIEIRETDEGVFVSVPRLTDDPLIPTLAGCLTGIAFVPIAMVAAPILRTRPSALIAVVTAAGLGAYWLLSLAIGRMRPKRPLTILVAAGRVRIEGAGLLRMTRNWKSQSITNASVAVERYRNGSFRRYVLAISRNGEQAITICEDRELIEIQRVVAALRRALHLQIPEGQAHAGKEEK